MGFVRNDAAQPGAADEWVPVEFYMERLHAKPSPVYAVQGGVVPHGIQYLPLKRLDTPAGVGGSAS